MALYGAKKFRFAPFAATNPEPDNALPNYGATVQLGSLNQVSETLNFSEVEARGDNARKIYLKEFTDGSLDVEMLYLSPEMSSAVLGQTLDAADGAKNLHFKDNDAAPYGGAAFYASCVKDDGSNTLYYQGVYYPKVRASMQGKSYQTKQKQIVLTNPKLTFSVDACNSHDFKIESEEFSTEAAADAWCTKMLAAAE